MIKVRSEIGRLKKVLIHRPGYEVENITPSTFEKLLFDDAMYLEIARQEHDEFKKTFEKLGIEVCYIEELVAETLDKNPDIKQKFIEEFLLEARVLNPIVKEATIKYLLEFKKSKEMVDKMIAGIYYNEVEIPSHQTLENIINDQIFITEPLPNVLFTRDNFASIGTGITLHRMYSETRRRETLLAHYVFTYHPDYKDTPRFYERNLPFHIEGGDINIMKNDTLAIGISQRTEAAAIDKLAEALFGEFEDQGYKTIYAFDIPKGRSSMHLDTVFTQIDVDKFSVYDDETMTAYKLTSKGKGKYSVQKITKPLSKILEDVFGKKITIFRVANGHPVHAEREQWNDGANVLAVAPNEIICYSRNTYTIDILRKGGVKVHIIPSSELSRGRGGPRCMSMPLIREDFYK